MKRAGHVENCACDKNGRDPDCAPMKRKPKVEAPAVRWAWIQAQESETAEVRAWRVKDQAQRNAPFMQHSNGYSLVALVPADPHAKLKADVVRAAERVFESWPGCLVAGDEERASMQAGRIGSLRRAVGALQKAKP